MRRVLSVILVNYVAVILLVLFCFGEGSGGAADHRRLRRYLAFENISHFFIRLNIKANMVPWNQIFAQAVGFRMNWDEPPDSFHHHRLYRRSLFGHTEELLDRLGIAGFDCIRRAMCEVNSVKRPGVYNKVLKIIFKNLESTSKWHTMSPAECARTTNNCPFSVLDVSLYTDM